MLSIGTKICQCRVERGLTQAALARLCSIPQPNLSNIEKGKQDLTVSTLLRIAAALEKEPAAFLKEEKRPAAAPLTRRTLEAIAAAAVHPQAQAAAGIRECAALFRAILPELQRRGSVKKADAAWQALKNRFTPAEIEGICRRIQDELQRSA